MQAKASQFEKPPPLQRRTSLQRALAATQHRLEGAHRSLASLRCGAVCAACGGGAPTRHVYKWLRSPCQPAAASKLLQGTAAVRVFPPSACSGGALKRKLPTPASLCEPVAPTEPPPESALAGASSPGAASAGPFEAPSRLHCVVFVGGVKICTHCGAYSTATQGMKAAVRRLGGPCGDPTRSGRQALNKLKKGQPPGTNMRAWPADDLEAIRRALLQDQLASQQPQPDCPAKRRRIRGKTPAAQLGYR